VLSRLPDLKVPARTSSFAYKGRNIDIRQIADDLGVDAVLEGSVRSAGDRVRITAQLVEGGTGYHAWSQSLDRQFEDLFGLQDDLASAVMMALAIDPASLPASVPTHDLEAYHLYMQAVPLFLRPTEANLRGAIELLQRAVERDPEFGRALSMLAIQYALSVFLDYSMTDALAVAERAAARALELDPRDGVAHDALGALSALRGDWLAAENHFGTAALLSSDPLTNGHRCIFVTTPVGHVRRSLQQAHEVFHATKGQPLGAMLLAVLHTHLGMDAEALRWADKAVALGQPRTVRPVPEIYATFALRAGRHDEAASHWIADLSPQMHAAGAAQAVESICVAWEHDPAQRPVAIEVLNRVEARLPPYELDRVTWTCRRLLTWYVMVGALDHAYRLADRSLAQYRRTGTIGAWGFLWIPEMASFRRDPRFQAFVSQLGNLMEYWHQHGPPDGCELRDGKLLVD
jgi:tetratricopeptide (TPR) repeat protein